MTAAGPLVLIILGFCALARRWRRQAVMPPRASVEVTITLTTNPSPRPLATHTKASSTARTRVRAPTRA